MIQKRILKKLEYCFYYVARSEQICSAKQKDKKSSTGGIGKSSLEMKKTRERSEDG